MYQSSEIFVFHIVMELFIILNTFYFAQEERQMEQLTREIGRAFSSGYRQVQTIKSAGRHETKPTERRLAASAVIALSTALQELGLQYRSAQNHYLTRMYLCNLI